jgi:hypothetical protein
MRRELDHGVLFTADAPVSSGNRSTTSRVYPQHTQPGAAVDGGELVVPGLAGAGQWGDELDVDLDPVAGQRFLVPPAS